MRIISLFIIFSLLSLLGGCASVERFNTDNEESMVYRGVYPATQMDLSVLAAAANDNGTSILSGLPLMMAPFAIIDIPFSLITDTIMLPYDAYKRYTYAPYINYWEDVAAKHDTTSPMSEYLEYYTHTGAVVVLRQSRGTNNEDLLKLYLRVASADDSEKILSASIIEAVVKEGEVHKVYSSLRELTCNTMAKNINNDKFRYASNLLMKGRTYSDTCIEKLAQAGMECDYTLRSVRLPEKYFRQCYEEDKTRYLRWLSENPSTPQDIRIAIFNVEYNRVIKKYGALDKAPGYETEKLKNTVRNAKSREFVASLYGMNDGTINTYLKDNRLLIKDGWARTKAVKDDSVGKKELLAMIKGYPSDFNMLDAIASSSLVDMDVYNQLMKYAPEEKKARVIEKIIFNNKLLDKDIPNQILANKETKELIESRAYEALLVYDGKGLTVNKQARLELIRENIEEPNFLYQVAGGEHVDMDIYNQLWKSTPEKSRKYLLSFIIHNKKLQDEAIHKQLLVNKNTKAIVDDETYNYLLAFTEVPVIKITDFGVLYFKEDESAINLKELLNKPDLQSPGRWLVENQKTTIPNKLGINFGIFYVASREYSNNSVDLQYEIIYPQGGIIDPETGEVTTIDVEKGSVPIGEEHVFFQTFDHPWEIKSGKWVFQLKYKGKIIAKKVFYIESV